MPRLRLAFRASRRPGDIVAYRVIETPRSTSHSGASRAGQRIARRVGEISARRELKHARVRLETESCDAHAVSPKVQAVSSRTPDTGDESRENAAAPPIVGKSRTVMSPSSDAR
jgi:hypothetical protein